jgi:hypothetical protein
MVVGVGVSVGVGEGVCVGVSVGVGVDVGVGVAVGLGVGVGVGVGLALGEDNWLNANIPITPAKTITNTIREATDLVMAVLENWKCFNSFSPQGDNPLKVSY